MNEGPLQALIQQFTKLPGIGSRSARRIVLYLLRHQHDVLRPLAKAMEHAADQCVVCDICSNVDTSNPCHICTDTKRDQHMICVVEDLADLWAIERSRLYRGLYHVLGGTLSALDKRGPDALNIPRLAARASAAEVQEIILATNATVEGQTTAHYITEQLAGCNVRISRLAQGIPIGGELDYLDDGTLGAAFRARLPF